MDGNVVGINSAIFSPSGGSVGIGFAIPSNLARSVIQQLRQFGEARRGWIGVRIQGVTQDIADGLGLPSTQGALIANVTPNGPAAKAGLQNGDLVVGFDGRPIDDSRSLSRIVADTPIGKQVAVDVLRKSRKATFHLQIAKLDEGPPDRPGAKLPAPTAPKTKTKTSQLGLSLGMLDGEARAKFKLAAGAKGVVVTDVDPASAAADKNIRPGDVIVEVQNQAVKSPDEVEAKLVADAKAGRKVELLLVNRGGDLAYVGVPMN
jgi:serine protease Do